MSTPIASPSPVLQALWRLGVDFSAFERVVERRPAVRQVLEDLAVILERMPLSWEDAAPPRLVVDELLRAALVGWAVADDDVTLTERYFVLVSEIAVGLDEVIANVADAPVAVHRLRRQVRKLRRALADEGWPSKLDDDSPSPSAA